MALTEVELIKNGVIVDADISASAAIDPLKIAGTAVITTDSRLSDTRAPTDESVTEAKLANGAVTAAKASIASQVQAETGTDSTTLMTPERTAQAIAAQSQGGVSLGLAIALG